jgi:iron complex outermembrane receptor protein
VRGVAVLLDGVPLSEPDGVARLDMIELAAARQVEVVRGPASALYAGSAGGVLNVISRTGHDSPGIIARGQAGDFGFRKFDGRAGGLLGDGRRSWIAAASQTSTDGYRAHSDAQITRGQMLLDFASASTRFSIQGVGSRLDSRLPGSLTQTEIDKDPRIAAPPATAFQFGRGDDRYRVGAQLDQEFGTGAANTYFFYGGRTLDFPIPFQIVDLNLHRIQGGGRLRSNRIAELPLDVTIGVDYDRVFGTDRRRVNNAGVAGALRDDGWFAILGEGAYAQLEWRPIAQVETTFGVRDDRVGYKFQSKSANAIPKQEVTFNQASPRFTTVWHPRSVTTVYASAGRGFEPPAVGELSASPGNPVGSVHPKSLWNFELGARHLIANRVRIDGAAFVAAVRGEFVPVTVGGLSFPENASHSRNAGVELGVTALATRWLDFSAAYTFLDLRLTDYATSVVNSSGVREQVDFSGKHIPGVSKNAFSAEASLRPFDRLSVGVQTEYQGLVYVETSNARRGTLYAEAAPGGTVQQVPFRAVPARALFHLNGDFRVGKLNVLARVENLFAQKYVANVIANESSGRFYEPGSRRSASIGLSVGTTAAPRAIP